MNGRLIDGEKVDVPDLPADVRKAYSLYQVHYIKYTCYHWYWIFLENHLYGI